MEGVMRIIPAVLRSLSAAAALLSALGCAASVCAAQAPASSGDAASVPAALPANCPQAGEAPDAQATVIDYTGSLLGYYRMEASDAQAMLDPVEKFLSCRATDKGNEKLLLGMGDNFGPEFGASLQLENDNSQGHATGCYEPPTDTGDGESRPESLYKDDNRVAPKAQCDNVLNFMMHAGFRAIVPGSQDFMYTARWLRASALLLEDAARDHEQLELIQNRDHRLDMLGANLRIVKQKKNADGSEGGAGEQDGSGGETPCPLLFAADPLAAGTVRCVGDGSVPEPLDWLGRLDRLSRQGGTTSTLAALQALATESAVKANGRQTELDTLVTDEISILVSAWGRRFPVPALPAGAGSRTADSAEKELDAAEVRNLAGALEAMPACADASAPGDDRRDMCAYAARLAHILRCRNAFVEQAQGAAPADTCPAEGAAGEGGSATANGQRRVTGADLTLTEKERDAARRGLLRTVALEEKNVGYTVATTANGRKVLVIGVAGEDTMKAVSQTNLKLCPARPGAGTGDLVFGRCSKKEQPGARGSQGYTVLVTDPVEVTEALVRGANLLEGHFDSVVVMAQMPHTEAEVLSERVSAWLRLAGKDQGAQPVDAVLSEAESGYGSPHLTLNYPDAAQTSYPAPVLTPLNSYSSQPMKYVYPGAVSELRLISDPQQGFTVTNQSRGIFDPPTLVVANRPDNSTNGDTRTTITLLYQLMDCLAQSRSQGGNGQADPDALKTCLDKPPAQGTMGVDEASSQKGEFALLQDLEVSRRPRPDVVLLESRDVELDEMGPGYMGYEMCADEKEPEKRSLCMVRSALDRIFWKGDYVAYVAVTGKDLKDILTLSEKKMAEQAELADTGYTREWLISYGIVQSSLANITEVSRNNEPLWIPVDPTCVGTIRGQSTYCVGGTPIADDAYYWLLTTDQLAQDKAVYGTLQALPGNEHVPTEMFITAPLAHYLLASLHAPAGKDQALAPTAGPGPARATNPRRNPPVENVVTYNNEVFQQGRLLQVDFSKVVASFTSRDPEGGNLFVGDYFQGVSDSRATAPAQQELDLEAASRVTSNMPGLLAGGRRIPPMSFGIQSAFSYDRSVLGNLTPQTKAINASYSLNNFTAGGFLQIRLRGRHSADGVTAVRSLPRSLLVFAPRQYQVQINHQYLFFPFATSSPPPGELRVTLPRNDVWTDRAGFREEFGHNSPKAFFWSGDYVEAGAELSEQANVLSSLTLQDGAGTPVTCSVSASITLQTCFTAAKLVINDSSPATKTHVVGSPGVKTLHSPGFYWQLHIQNRVWGRVPNKQFSLVTESQGDYYAGRPVNLELPTQTEYAIPLSLSLVVPALGNLSFAPSYSAFFYKSQLSAQSLQVNSLSIAARWYFARDARVPIRRQARLPGPASADQTKTGKAH
jgi:hypothetical protein